LIERIRCKASLNQRDEIHQAIRFGAENDDGDLSTSEILLVFEPPVHGQENLESLTLCNRKEFAVFFPPSNASGTV